MTGIVEIFVVLLMGSFAGVNIVMILAARFFGARVLQWKKSLQASNSSMLARLELIIFF